MKLIPFVTPLADVAGVRLYHHTSPKNTVDVLLVPTGNFVGDEPSYGVYARLGSKPFTEGHGDGPILLDGPSLKLSFPGIGARNLLVSSDDGYAASLTMGGKEHYTLVTDPALPEEYEPLPVLDAVGETIIGLGQSRSGQRVLLVAVYGRTNYGPEGEPTWCYFICNNPMGGAGNIAADYTGVVEKVDTSGGRPYAIRFAGTPELPTPWGGQLIVPMGMVTSLGSFDPGAIRLELANPKSADLEFSANKDGGLTVTVKLR